MAQRRWTFVIVPHGSATSRNLEVSASALKLAGALVAAALMVVLALGFATITRSFDLAKAEKLERDNAVLAEEIGPVFRYQHELHQCTVTFRGKAVDIDVGPLVKMPPRRCIQIMVHE